MNGKITKFLAVAGTGLAMMAAVPAANAACTKPVGTYAGSATGTVLGTGAGAFRGAAAVSLSIKIASDGSLVATEKGKTLAGVYSATWKVSASKNSFNATTCQGTWVTNYGIKFTYTSTGSGNVITFIDTTVNGVLNLYDLRLEKV